MVCVSVPAALAVAGSAIADVGASAVASLGFDAAAGAVGDAGLESIISAGVTTTDSMAAPGFFSGVGDAISSALPAMSALQSGSSLIGGLSGPASSLSSGNAGYASGLQSSNVQLQNAQRYDFLSNQAIYNSNISQANFEYEQNKSTSDDARLRDRNSQTIGNEAAVQGASGVDVNSGSALDTRVANSNNGELNVLLQNYEARQRERGDLIQEQASADQANQYTQSAAQSRANSGYYSAAAATSLESGRVSAVVKGLSSLPDFVNSGSKLVGMIS